MRGSTGAGAGCPTSADPHARRSGAETSSADRPNRTERTAWNRRDLQLCMVERGPQVARPRCNVKAVLSAKVIDASGIDDSESQRPAPWRVSGAQSPGVLFHPL